MCTRCLQLGLQLGDPLAQPGPLVGQHAARGLQAALQAL